MSTPDPTQPPLAVDPSSPLFFLRSPVFVSIAVAFISKVLTLFGRHVSDAIINSDVQQVLDCLTLLSLAYAGFKRWRSTTQPLSIKTNGVSNANAQPAASAPVGADPPAPGNVVALPVRGTPGITEEPPRGPPGGGLPPAA